MKLHAQPATPDTFAPYGHVLAPEAARSRWPINNGATMRHHGVAPVECTGATTIISVFEALEIPEPGYEITLIENHPFGSQAFMPLAGQQLIVVVGKPGEARPDELACFAMNGAGASFAPGVWHATLIAPQGGSFLIVDRDEPDDNCEVHTLIQSMHVHW